MTTDVAAAGSAPIQQSPTERARAVLAKHRIAARAMIGDCPDTVAVAAMIEFASQAAQPAEADGVEPSAYLKHWWLFGEPRCRVDLSEINEPWLEALKPTVTPLYATLKAPATDAGEVEPVAWTWEGRDRAHRWEPRLTPYHPGKDNDYCRNVRPLFATPPAPNDDLRAALAEDGPVPNVSLCTWEVAGPWWKRRARKLERAIEAALKENRRG